MLNVYGDSEIDRFEQVLEWLDKLDSADQLCINYIHN